MTEPAPVQPEEPSEGQSACAGSTMYRRVSVKGSGGVAAAVIVTTYRGQVRISIVPPFTWEAIMEPGKVDELIHTLSLARAAATRETAIRLRMALG
ncbi:MAG: hypothetical protein ACRDSR_28260 [Pseudonocardiaceae bacterium]